MQDSLVVRFEYSADEHATAIMESPERRAIMKWAAPGMLAAVLLGFVIAALGGKLNLEPQALAFTGILLLPFLALSLALPRLAKRSMIARLQRERATSTSEVEARQIGASGFTLGGSIDPIPWLMITRVVESRNFYYFYHATSETPEYLPKHALSRADAEVLESLLTNQFRARSADLQLLPRAT